MTWHVQIDTGSRERSSVPLGRLPACIGRARHNEVVLPGWTVASVHARIEQDDDGLRIHDCGSFGGTFVNGLRVSTHGPLTEADVVAIGPHRLRVCLRPPAGETTPVPAHDAVPAPGSAPVTPIGSDVELRRRIRERLLEVMDLRRTDVRRLSDAELREQVHVAVRGIVAEVVELDGDTDLEALCRAVVDEAVGYGPIESLMSDPAVTEIMVNGPDEIWVERAGRLERSGLAFTSDEAVRAIIDRMVAPLGRRIDESSPMVDARLPDGSRINAIIPPVAVDGAALTIRRFGGRRFDASDLVAQGSASLEMVEFLRLCVQQRRSIVVSGGTGAGKTSLLNLLSDFIPHGERLVSIEDAAELRLRHPHLVRLEARPANGEGRGGVTIRELVRNALRMRPDRILVGECRGGEAIDMLQAMNTGHEGSMTTVHANSPRDAIARLETMGLMAGLDLPLAAIREQIAAAVDVVVQQSRAPDGRRRITQIVEVAGVENGRIQVNELFRHRPGVAAADAEGFETTGLVPPAWRLPATRAGEPRLAQ